ncbi:hypothetical protein D9M72_459440 [compost metagenome]
MEEVGCCGGSDGDGPSTQWVASLLLPHDLLPSVLLGSALGVEDICRAQLKSETLDLFQRTCLGAIDEAFGA